MSTFNELYDLLKINLTNQLTDMRLYNIELY